MRPAHPDSFSPDGGDDEAGVGFNMQPTGSGEHKDAEWGPWLLRMLGQSAITAFFVVIMIIAAVQTELLQLPVAPPPPPHAAAALSPQAQVEGWLLQQHMLAAPIVEKKEEAAPAAAPEAIAPPPPAAPAAPAAAAAAAPAATPPPALDPSDPLTFLGPRSMDATYPFYSGPQHSVRYPASMQYRGHEQPFCGYRHGAAPVSQPKQLTDCIERHRQSYRNGAEKQSQELPCNKKRRIFDAFRYNDEHSMLETRIEENWNEVDYFVIIETTMAFSGAPKEMAFVERVLRGDYQRWLPKIIHVSCDLSHIHVENDNNGNPGRGWPREHASAACLRFALAMAEPDDIILFSDTDEIPKPEVLSALKMCSAEMSALVPNVHDHNTHRSLVMSGPRFVGSWKWQHTVFHEQKGTSASLRHSLDAHSGEWTRNNFNVHLAHLRDAQWHCSTCFMGDWTLLKSKMSRWSELEASKGILAQPEMTQKWITDCGSSHIAHECKLYPYEKLPKWVQNNPQMFKDKGFAA